MENKTPKPQLHQSHMSTLYFCGVKFERLYLHGEKEPPTTPLVIGTATHAVNALNLTNKIEKGTLLTREAVQDLSRDEFIKTWHETPIMLNEEEVKNGLSKTRGSCQDTTISLALAYHYGVASKINPRAVERKWVLEAVGYPFDFAGTIDVDEDKEYDYEKGIFLPTPLVAIRDTKTKKINTGQHEVDNSEQYSGYAFAKYMIDGVMPDEVWQDNLIKPTANRPAYVISYKSTRTKYDFEVFKNRFGQACNVIEKQAFTPSNPKDPLCSKRFCGFAADGSCKYFNSKRSLTMPVTVNTKENKYDGTDKAGIIASLTSIIENK